MENYLKYPKTSTGFQTSDGSLFNFSTDEVDKFVKEIPHFDGRKNRRFRLCP